MIRRNTSSAHKTSYFAFALTDEETKTFSTYVGLKEVLCTRCEQF